ncbi:hypothetical protein HHK36_011487 [Tetracentron sinense]|uniref:RRM domain-containing protein n=1 Tax=Tetracentron sinense TaxID=13715 RepID=A0A834ZAG7_TETSI|nr:hypothetical protein HHK36_011487 [Tetracentron sinense]
MAASSISMAAATSASAGLHNLSSFDYSPNTTTIIAAKSKPKTLKSKTQNPHLFLLPLLPHSHRCHALSAFDSFEDDEEDEIQEEEEEDQEAPVPEGSRLYVGNLPYAMTSSQLADIFDEAGRVDSVEIVYDRVTDRSRGFGFVTMGSFEEAKKAIRMFDGSQVGGRSVKVNFPEVPRGGEREVMGPKIRSSYRGFVDSPHKIYAGNLGWGVTSQGLRDTFADQPGLLSAKVIYDRDFGRSRGFGFITFASAEEAQSALDAMNGVEVEGRPLRLNLAAERDTPASSTQKLERKTETDLHGGAMLSSIST